MDLEFSDELTKKLQADGSLPTVLDYITGKRFIKSIVTYVTNKKYAQTRVNIHDFVKTTCSVVPSEVQKDLKYLKGKSHETILKAVLKYVHSDIKYVKDKTAWQVEEYWQDPLTTWMKQTGDCEDGALLIYAILRWLGIPKQQLFLVCSTVKGGGHAYVIYRSAANVEYPVDWCYWYDTSVKFIIPYILRDEYYGGTKEWFRVNEDAAYKTR